MADDRNDWVPKFDLRQDGATVTQVPQSDGTIKYFQGNYDEKGELDRVRVNSPGIYKAIPTVQLKDANGDDVSHRGAAFRVVLNTKGQVLDVEIPIGMDGSGFDDEANNGILKAVLTTANAADTVEAADCDAIIKTGQWMDITQSEADVINKRAQDGFHHINGTVKRSLQNQKLGTVDADGNVTGLNIRTGLQA